MPRRITSTGFGVGGALATLASCWAAGKFATADVRCITLGAPRVGNKTFKKVFENLVGATYRVVLEGDAMTMMPKSEGFLKKYADVGHTVWLREGEVRYEVRSRPLKRPATACMHMRLQRLLHDGSRSCVLCTTGSLWRSVTSTQGQRPLQCALL